MIFFYQLLFHQRPLHLGWGSTDPSTFQLTRSGRGGGATTQPTLSSSRRGLALTSSLGFFWAPGGAPEALSTGLEENSLHLLLWFFFSFASLPAHLSQQRPPDPLTVLPGEHCPANPTGRWFSKGNKGRPRRCGTMLFTQETVSFFPSLKTNRKRYIYIYIYFFM